MQQRNADVVSTSFTWSIILRQRKPVKAYYICFHWFLSRLRSQDRAKCLTLPENDRQTMITAIFESLSLHDEVPALRYHDHRNRQDCFTIVIFGLGKCEIVQSEPSFTYRNTNSAGLRLTSVKFVRVNDCLYFCIQLQWAHYHNYITMIGKSATLNRATVETEVPPFGEKKSHSSMVKDFLGKC